MDDFEIIIIGGGPNGLACAIEGIQKGLKVLVIEKGTITESISRYPFQMKFFSTADNIAIGNIPFTINSPKATREEALNYYRNVVEFYKIPLRLYCKVENILRKDGFFHLETNTGNTYRSKNVVIATGYFDFPRKLHVPGETLPHVKHYYDEPYPYAHRKIAIIGAGNSAVEAALDLYRHGVDVSLIVRGESMKKTAKYWLIPDLMNRIKEGKVKAFYNHQILEIKSDHIVAKDLVKNQKATISANNVFVLTGYLPDVTFMKQAGIEIKKDSLEPSFNEETYQTNIEGLYVAGTVTAGIRTEKVFIENGRLHGKFIIDDIIQKKTKAH